MQWYYNLTIAFFMCIIGLVVVIMVSIINSFLKMFIVLSLTIYVCNKIVNNKEVKTQNVVISIFSCAVISVMYAYTDYYIKSASITIGYTLILGIIYYFAVKSRKANFWLVYLTAFCVSYITYLISVCIVSIFIYMIPNIEVSSPLCSISISICSLVITILIFKTSRLKNGINFIKSYNGNKNIVLIFLVILFLLLLVQDVLQKGIEETQILRFVTFSVIVGFVVVFYIISQLITKHYRNNIRDRNISIQKEEIDASEKIIGELKEQNLKLATTIHKYNHRLSALENSIRKVMDSSNTEFAKELAVVLEQTKKVKTQFAEETKVSVALPTTNVVAVDNMLEYMKNECEKCGIDFTVKLSDSIIPLLNKYISEDKFETLLGDHIKDAIIAINANHAGYKGIMVLIGIVDNAYELSVYDTGIEFEIPVLVNLGISAITTHKDEGGTGLGFMTTFETLKSSKASLVIEEYDKRVTNYTKSVTIRFDGKCDYRVYSYRAEEIKEQCGRRNIVIKKI